jgi:hypothetical protein
LTAIQNTNIKQKFININTDFRYREDEMFIGGLILRGVVGVKGGE